MVQAASPEASYIAELIKAFGVGIAIVILIVAALVVAGWHALIAFITRRVSVAAEEQVQGKVREHQAALAKELESHRVQLSLSADSARLTFQRQLQEFNLYAAKRYEVYSELFRQMLEAEGALGAIYGLRSEPSFEHESREDIEALMKERSLPSGLREEILGLIASGNRQRWAERLRAILRDMERDQAVRKYWEARNYYLINELFLSDVALPIVEKAFDALHDMVGIVRFPESARARGSLETKRAMSSAVDQVRQVMRRDLQRSDFTPRPRDDEAAIGAPPPNER